MRPKCLAPRMDVVYFNQYMYTESSIPFATWNFQNFNHQFKFTLLNALSLVRTGDKRHYDRNVAA